MIRLLDTLASIRLACVMTGVLVWATWKDARLTRYAGTVDHGT